jgi:PmbA protein
VNSTATVTDHAIGQGFVTDIVTQALRAGATDAEAIFAEGDEFETLVRLGQVEQLKEAGFRARALNSSSPVPCHWCG